MWLTLTLQLDAQADSIGKLIKGTNKTLLCSGNVSGMLGAVEEAYLFYKEKDTTLHSNFVIENVILF